MAQCNFLVQRLERLLSGIAKAIAEEEIDFELAEIKTENSSLLQQLEDSTNYLIDISDLVSEYRRLLKRNINATDATSAAINSAQSNNQNAPILRTASSNQSTLIEFSANSSATSNSYSTIEKFCRITISSHASDSHQHSSLHCANFIFNNYTEITNTEDQT